MFCSWSPSTATISAELPAVSEPIRSLQPKRSALLTVEAWMAPIGVIPHSTIFANCFPFHRVLELPYLTQTEYDHLLWSCDLNFVRGEDSFVRAQWAGAPFVWQIYPQADQAHEAKLEAFLDLHLGAADAGLGVDLRALWRAWNGLGTALRWPDPGAWRAHSEDWCTRLGSQPDLGTQLLGFVREKR